MGAPERFSESDVASVFHGLLRDEQLSADRGYSRAELLSALKGAEGVEDDPDNFFVKFRSIAQDYGRVGDIEVLVTGRKKGRRYSFLSDSLRPEELASAPRPPIITGNDHPEDRAHVAVHLALLLTKRCVGLSLPKTGGAVLRGNRRDQNPDFVGIAAAAERVMLGASRIPEWLAAEQPRARYTLVGAEVKPKIETETQLYDAVRQARHNCRYFDEGWLVAQVAQSLGGAARMLGEEYDVGILSFSDDPITRVEVLWMASPTRGRQRPTDFFARFDGPRLDELFGELEHCRRLADKIGVGAGFQLRLEALRQLLTNQRSDSMILRLPKSIQDSLVGKEENGSQLQDQEAVSAAVRAVLFDAYEYDSDEEDDLKTFVKKQDVGARLQRSSEFFSSRVRTLVLEELVKYPERTGKELTEASGIVRAWLPCELTK